VGQTEYFWCNVLGIGSDFITAYVRAWT